MSAVDRIKSPRCLLGHDAKITDEKKVSKYMGGILISGLEEVTLSCTRDRCSWNRVMIVRPLQRKLLEDKYGRVNDKNEQN